MFFVKAIFLYLKNSRISGDIMLEGLTVNYWAVLVSAIISMIIGAVWYSPLGFGQKWMKSMKFKKSEMKKMQVSANQAYALGFVSALLTMFVLAIFMQYSRVTSASHGASIAFLLWLGLAVPVLLGSYLWENKPWSAFLIGAGYQLVSLLIAGAILGVWI